MKIETMRNVASTMTSDAALFAAAAVGICYLAGIVYLHIETYRRMRDGRN